MDSVLSPIKIKRSSDLVFEQLRELIYRGQLKPGQQLMPERELSEVMNVSRTTIRNAIGRLVVMGLLEQRQGKGTFVKRPDAMKTNPLAKAMEAQDASVEDLLEVRMGLESNAAALAATRASVKDIGYMEDSVKEMQQEVRSGRYGTEADVSFHMAISYATNNSAQIQVMKNFSDFLFFAIRESRKQLYEEPAQIEKILEQHTQILQAIKNRDAAEAYRTMKEHIQFVIDFIKR
jgi:GntR family transcriptional regulator, transcriptional repressor for pyruvate dehydrogenase complex